MPNTMYALKLLQKKIRFIRLNQEYAEVFVEMNYEFY